MLIRRQGVFRRSLFTSPHVDITVPSKTTWQVISEKAEKYGDKTALICGISGKTMNFHEFTTSVKKTATSFAKQGMKPGDVIATNMINCFEYPILYHAATALGVSLSPASPQFNAAEITRQLDASESLYLVTHTAVKDPAIAAAKEFGIPSERVWCAAATELTAEYTPFRDLIDLDETEIDIPQVSIDIDRDVNLLPFSSGTTGVPKGVMLSHRNVLSNMLQVDAIEKFNVATLLLLPIFHIYPFLLMNLSLYQGVAQVHLPKFEPETLLSALQKYKIPKAHVVPPVAIFLAKHPMVDNYDLSSMTHLVSAAAPMGADTETQVKQRLNVEVKQAYGMTEMSPCTHYTTDDSTCAGSIGQLVPNTELKIMSLDDSKTELAVGEKGELWARGPQIMLGYKGNKEATANTIMEDGFLRTGDIGYVDQDGFGYIVDRVKELIKYKGHQIAPAELEDVLLSHPSIADASCIRGKDQDGEEFPKAYVVMKPDHSLSEQQIIDYVAERVAPFKKVRGVAFIDQIPKTPTGKILRRELQQLENETQGIYAC